MSTPYENYIFAKCRVKRKRYERLGAEAIIARINHPKWSSTSRHTSPVFSAYMYGKMHWTHLINTTMAINN